MGLSAENIVGINKFINSFGAAPGGAGKTSASSGNDDSIFSKEFSEKFDTTKVKDQDAQSLKDAFVNFRKNGTDENKEKFMQAIAKADMGDNQKADLSVIKDENAKKVTKEEVNNAAQEAGKNTRAKTNIFNILKSYDSVDDGKVNGSVFNDTATISFLDKMDDGQENGSVNEYVNSLKSGEVDLNTVDANGNEMSAIKQYNPSNLMDGYNVFNGNGFNTSNFFKSQGYNSQSAGYNSSQYGNDTSVNTANVKPADIIGDGIPAEAAKKALSYIGASEANGGARHFQNNQWHKAGNEAWCADFVSTVYNEVTDGKCPWGFNASVAGIRGWAQGQNNATGKEIYVTNTAENRKKVGAGDLIVFEGAGSSHIGMVTKIDPDGTIHTIEGNTSDKVAERSYKPNDPKITSFVRMSELTESKKKAA